jgi:peptidoglycan hydrolase-like protein with peptidoglycan-binding domain
MSTGRQPRDGRDRSRDHSPPDRQSIFNRAFLLGVLVTLGVAAIIVVILVIANSGDSSKPAAPKLNTPAHKSSSSKPKYQTGPQVVTLQKDLAALHYYSGPDDGVYGPSTKAAVEAFQRANGLTADGIAGAQTLALINKRLTGTTTKTGSSTATPTTSTTAKKHGGTSPTTTAGTGGSGL